MAESVTTVNTAIDTWQILINQVNLLATLASTDMVTANGSANGSFTSGNAYVNGILAAPTIAAGLVRGGNVQNSSGTLNLQSPVAIGNTEFLDLTYSTSNTSAQAIDTFSTTSYRTAKYVVQIVAPTIGYQSTEIILMHDGTNTYQTEYASLYSNTILGTFTSSIANSVLSFTFTPNNANNTLRVIRTTLPA